MRLSTAIALGRTLCKPVPFTQDDGQGGGCALGMAARAMGEPSHQCSAKEFSTRVTYPCDCFVIGIRASLPYAIVHLFNCHVCGKQDWTLDKLIDFVRANEPAEREEITAKENADDHQVCVVSTRHGQ